MSRWKEKLVDKKKKLPAKVLHYLPLIQKQRLQMLFMPIKTIEHMMWHVIENCDDGLMRYPKDFEVWKKFF